jgi:hypothetical protein
MKKYSTSEAIAMLEKNPKLRFKTCIGNIIAKKDNGDIVWEANSCAREENEWELIQQPVPFMEAVKAYSEGKKVEVEKDGTRYDWHGVIHLPSLPRTKWYIKEESHE